jgi:dienelactone hydrolase
MRCDLAVADWTAALEALTALSEVAADRVGYWGLSMGTDYSLPFIAANPRVTTTVLGLFGAGTGDRLGEQAMSLAQTFTASVLWVMQWDDTVFDRAGQLALFDAVGSADKRIIVYPGDHGDTPDEGLRLVREFLVRELGRVGS